jgi:hypothetical protein
MKTRQYSDCTCRWCLRVLIAVIAPLIGVIGCTRTVVGGYVDSPDRIYGVYGRIYGAYGRSFLDNTTKTIHITIVASRSPEKVVLSRQYRVRGSNVGWNAIWCDHTNLAVVVFEYPPGVSRWDLTRPRGPTNHLLTVTYALERNSPAFVELARHR